MEERRRTPLTVLPADPHACTPGVRIRVLGEVPFFAGLRSDELARVDGRCSVRAVDAAESIYFAGDPARHLYVVATGIVKITRATAEGRETLLDLLGPGDFLGALPALGATHYADSAWALTPVCLLVLDAADFDAVLQQMPAVALAALEAVSRRLAEARDAVHRLSATPLEQRLAATLLLLADKVGEPWKGGVLLQVPLTREDLAAMTGARTESVSRVVSAWRRQGFIETGRRWVAIRDRRALNALLDE